SLMNDDKDMLEDLIVTALNDAARKVESTTQSHMSGVMPAGMKLPF
ncbi:MAG TPA: YbaB/EbfC family nucleoid-associated protein, partial [Methylophilaceae bacterium]|nr:YbaB/EbfC family nucleoid-associated protein [Methylophilaceae bacterium]